MSDGARPDVSDGARPGPTAAGDVTAEAVTDGPRDPLLSRAEGIADLPLDERPGAFDGLNRALVAELQQLEEA